MSWRPTYARLMRCTSVLRQQPHSAPSTRIWGQHDTQRSKKRAGWGLRVAKQRLHRTQPACCLSGIINYETLAGVKLGHTSPGGLSTSSSPRAARSCLSMRFCRSMSLRLHSSPAPSQQRAKQQGASSCNGCEQRRTPKSIGGKQRGWALSTAAILCLALAIAQAPSQRVNGLHILPGPPDQQYRATQSSGTHRAWGCALHRRQRTPAHDGLVVGGLQRLLNGGSLLLFLSLLIGPHTLEGDVLHGPGCDARVLLCGWVHAPEATPLPPLCCDLHAELAEPVPASAERI